MGEDGGFTGAVEGSRWCEGLECQAYSTGERQPDSYCSSSLTIGYSAYILNKYVADCVMVNKTHMVPISIGL